MLSEPNIAAWSVYLMLMLEQGRIRASDCARISTVTCRVNRLMCLHGGSDHNLRGRVSGLPRESYTSDTSQHTSFHHGGPDTKIDSCHARVRIRNISSPLLFQLTPMFAAAVLGQSNGGSFRASFLKPALHVLHSILILDIARPWYHYI